MGGIEDDSDKKASGLKEGAAAPHISKGVQADLFEDASGLVADSIAPGTPTEVFEQADSFNQEVNAVLAPLREKHPNVDIDILRDLSAEAVRNARAQQQKKPRKVLNPEEAQEEYKKNLRVYAGNLIFEGFASKKMPLPLFYISSKKWADVCNSPEYPLQQKALNILRENVSDMLDIVTPEESERLRIYDLGVGTGQKGEIITEEAIDKNGRHIEFHGVDASEEMLRFALGKYAKKIVHKALEKKDQDPSEWKNDKWRSLIEFIRKHDLTYSDYEEYVDQSFVSIFGKHYKDQENVNLLKFIFARTLSLHTKKGKALLRKVQELDNKVQLPLTMCAHANWFEELNKEEFIPRKNEGLVAFNLGSEVNNQFTGISVQWFANLLVEPKIPKHESGIIPLKEEKSVNAPYAVLGLELGKICHTQEHFRVTRTQMRDSYNNKAGWSMVEHPFLNGDVTFVSSETKKVIKFEDIGFIYVDYEEDPDNPGYYGATLRLYVTEDVTIYDAEKTPIHIAGKKSAYETFNKVADALFGTNLEKSLKGRKNAIMKSLGISTKEEFLAVGPKTFFSRDYSHYWNGIQIAETITGEPADLEQTLLYPSYKPSLEQITSLCHEKGLKVIKVYADDDELPTYVKILIRKMTPEEQVLFASGNRDPEIFYIPPTQKELAKIRKKRKKEAKKQRKRTTEAKRKKSQKQKRA